MPNQTTALIIPTFNEADNIIPLIQSFLKIDQSLQVIVADSDSPDQTGPLVTRTFADNPRVFVLPCSRTQGRGAAIAEAYQWIKTHLPTISFIATADADFSHHPDDFIKLKQALATSDIVIGSRYVATSHIVNWPLRRRVFSGLANYVARLVLRAGIKDYTNGYRVFTRRALEQLQLSQLDANGFIMLSQELAQWHKLGFTISEVPITFVNRRRGQSNLRPRVIIEAAWVLLKLSLSAKRAQRPTPKPISSPTPTTDHSDSQK